MPRCPTREAGIQDIHYKIKPKKVVILWDLDNKPPRGTSYEAAMSLKKVAQCFGEVVDMSAYANRHAFIHLPRWVVEQRHERRHLGILERKGVVTPSEPYVCSVCGRKCKTHLDLKRHFKQLHERERGKKLCRMRSLKGRKRQRFEERFVDGILHRRVKESLVSLYGREQSSSHENGELDSLGQYSSHENGELEAGCWL
ncbi:putative transcription factor LHW-like [Capsicum annuum]|uniref:C2H2-type domain-containing protein n=1 Tax=Capsicum annuum TaxID=4072 RepID=A0A2G2XYQ9_CAPAN|nr:putative transcription factor LHW-like [Capsicum annuum]KAF3656410.1 putative transcription factor LHW-like [Capsicum annuum]PHT62633.1 hypothetical protein T459_33528 [Capsicum annuum]